jgi:fatty acid synthase
MELNGLDKVICSRRERPLLVGSVKSNLGHTEAASSFVSLAKAIIALDSGVIPPNLHYSRPNSQVEALKSGRIQVSLDFRSSYTPPSFPTSI